ncbi:MAG: hypothetical protein ACHQ8D_10395 [Candidatus Rokuibacteriota bacterium]
MKNLQLACLAVLLVGAEGTDPGTGVTLTRDGAAVVLSEAERSQIARRVEALIVGCAITSVTAPDLFAARALGKEWQDVRAGSHLYVRFPTPLRAERGRVQISEVVVGLEDPSFIGPELSRYDNQVVGHVKCSGRRALALMCAPPVRSHLLARQRANCAVYDRIGDPPEKE